MLYYLLNSLSEQFSVFNVVHYITFRMFAAGMTSFFIAMLIGPRFIRKMTKLQIGQVIRDDGPKSHFSKKGTPTMGGGFILISIVLSTLLWADLTHPMIWLVVFITSFYGVIGWVDDYLKVSKKNVKGIGGKPKLFLQILGAIIFVSIMLMYTEQDYTVSVPFLKNVVINLGLFLFVALVIFVLVGSSNAVNLTDGLDGLAIGPIMTTAFSLLVLSYCTGHFKIAEYLQIQFVKGAGELSIFCAAVVMAGMGFLWFNAFPAQVFMGDVGSLSLGGALGAVSVLTKNEILLVVIGGVFVLETLSVIVQVASFKLTGKRVFRMAPLHHHFELKGWAEPKVIVRFWIISIILAILGIATLKLR